MFTKLTRYSLSSMRIEPCRILDETEEILPNLALLNWAILHNYIRIHALVKHCPDLSPARTVAHQGNEPVETSPEVRTSKVS